jgi:hypothetical protein
MRRLIILSLLVVAILIRPDCVYQNNKINMWSSDLPEAAIKEFYSWYINLLKQSKEPFKQKVEMRKYTTPRLMKELNRLYNSPDGLDADYFIDAQDFDEDWENNITVSNIKVNSNRASADLLLDGKQLGKKRLKVNLVNINNSWKIDKVKGEQ